MNNSNEIIIRPATAIDVPVVASLVCAALADEDPWRSLRPPQEEVERLLLGALSDSQLIVMVLRDEGGAIVSAAVWDTSREKTTNPPSYTTSLSERVVSLVSPSDADAAHLSLSLLATRPDCQRRGYAKALASWGVDRARKQGVPIRVRAAARAYVLFSGMGFVDVGVVPLAVEGCVKTLLLEPKPRRRSRVAGLLSKYR
ncbi:Acyl-CoA N-acyltransferase [Ophiocordyceps camponoti-floridani]|uniref:Acyl-CoA N-acyltransferase n=1 Tax=Ophiocordyceps camponoti-floridani TaxID=2030778 RepID=A0A8H4Q7U0_9HYPO|nr:Acyl-CoA N-acyltransferase [Ophiocordyceps camponoti-floridani]